MFSKTHTKNSSPSSGPNCSEAPAASRAGPICARASAVKNEFYGDRTGMIVDPFGHRWHLATALVEA